MKTMLLASMLFSSASFAYDFNGCYQFSGELLKANGEVKSTCTGLAQAEILGDKVLYSQSFTCEDGFTSNGGLVNLDRENNELFVTLTNKKKVGEIAEGRLIVPTAFSATGVQRYSVFTLSEGELLTFIHVMKKGTGGPYRTLKGTAQKADCP